MKKRNMYSRSGSLRPGVVFQVMCLVLLGVFSARPSLVAESQPEMLEDAEPGDCKACHQALEMLPPSHVETADMGISECRECHQEPDLGLRTKLPLDHTHLLGGVGCRDCHRPEGEDFEVVMTGQCLECHGSFDEVASMTAHMDPDPHNSPHYGKEMDCDLCHHQHKSSENFCSQCHGWELKVP